MKSLVMSFTAAAGLMLGACQTVVIKTAEDLAPARQAEFQTCIAEKMSKPDVLIQAENAVEQSITRQQKPLSGEWKKFALLLVSAQIAHHICAEEFGLVPQQAQIKPTHKQSRQSSG